MSGDGFVVSDLLVSRWLGRWGIVTAVPLLDDERRHSGIGCAFHRPRLADAALSSAAPERRQRAFALLDSQRRNHHCGHRALAFAFAAAAQVADRRTLRSNDRRSDADISCARVTTAYGVCTRSARSRRAHLRDARARRVLTAIGPLALQVAWGMFAPLLMWALAVAVVWFGIEHLVVRWITYLERITSAYASGRHSVRPERVSRGAGGDSQPRRDVLAHGRSDFGARNRVARFARAERDPRARDSSSREEQSAARDESAEPACASHSRSARGSGVRRSAQPHQRARHPASAAVRIRKPAGSRPASGFSKIFAPSCGAAVWRAGGTSS